MSMTQFAMVEELGSLVKDNLPCKHLVLSVEEALVNFLETDTSCNGTLELEPMNAYNRLLMHRLADIFGFSHVSVGEGEDRHLILERCAETSIPSILVSDILWQYDEPQSPTTPHQLLRRSETSPMLKTKSTPIPHSLEEREAAYLAARERIFSGDSGEEKEPVKQKPRSVPVVARRMIAHALGQRINACNNVTTPKDFSGSEGQKVESNTQLSGKNMNDHISGTEGQKIESNTQLSEKNTNDHISISKSSAKDIKVPQNKSDKISSGRVVSGRERNGVDHKKEQLGAAKRMFAQALGKQAGVSKSSESRP